MPDVVNVAAMMTAWQSTVHPVISFIYIRSLRIALCDIMKSMISMLNLKAINKVSQNAVHLP